MSAPDLLAAGILCVIAISAILRLSLHRPRASLSPVAVRATPPARPPTVARPGGRRNRTTARIATIVTAAVLVLLTPTLAAPPYSGPPELLADPQTASLGGVVSIDGAGFEDHLQGQLALDGDTGGMPTFRVRGNGTFHEDVTLPQSVGVGPHVVSALAPELLASVTITVIAEPVSPTPTAVPVATPTPTPAPVTPSPTPTPTPAPVTPSPTPTPTPAPSSSATAGVDHVFVVMMENHAYSQVWDTTSTPYTTALVHANALAANYYAITHPSLPNYLDIYAGSNYGITTDCGPSTSCHVSARNLADNLEAAGISWKGYFEDMPAPCHTSDSGGYIAHHNPFIYFDDIRTNTVRCAAHVVNYNTLSADLATSATTPGFAFIVPNNCHNTHDCPVATGDTWLSNNLPPLLDSPACTAQRCLLVLTWDEDSGNDGNHVLTVFAGSAARSGFVSSTTYDHYDLLGTVESLFGVPTQTAHDAAATSMTDMLK